MFRPYGRPKVLTFLVVAHCAIATAQQPAPAPAPAPAPSVAASAPMQLRPNVASPIEEALGSTRLRVTSPAVARTAPPYGPLNLFVGDRVFNVKEGEVVEVVERKTYGGFSGSQVWLRVARQSAEANPERTTAWIPAGSLARDAILPDRVAPVKAAPAKPEK